MMIPGYIRQTPPRRHGGNRLAGLGSRYAAGIGAAVARFGADLAQWDERRQASKQAVADREAERASILAASDRSRQLDERRLAYMLGLKEPEQRQRLTAVAVDPVSGSERRGYDVELERFGDWMRGQFDELAGDLSPRARELFSLEYDRHYATWAGHFSQTVAALEIEDVTVRARELARDGRTAEAAELADLYADRLGPAAHEQLTAEVTITGAMADLRGLAETDGWEAARAAIDDPAWQAVYDLDVAEAAKVRDALGTFIRDEAALAERAEAIEQMARERGYIDQAYEDGRAVEMDAVRADYLAGRISQGAYEAVRRLTIAGPPDQNDPAAFAELIALEDAVARGSRPGSDLAAYARANADRLTRSTYERAVQTAGSPFAMQTQAKNDAVQRAYGQLVLVQEDDLREMMIAGLSPETIQSAGQRRAQQLNLVNMVADELEAYLAANPRATRTEIIRKGREIVVGLRDRQVAEQQELIRRWEQGAVGGPPRDETRPPAGGEWPGFPVPLGLESIWPSLSIAEQGSVLRMMADGVTVEEILAELTELAIERGPDGGL